jgi:hypothetical protein
MVAGHPSETSVNIYRTTRPHNPEDNNLQLIKLLSIETGTTNGLTWDPTGNKKGIFYRNVVYPTYDAYSRYLSSTLPIHLHAQWPTYPHLHIASTAVWSSRWNENWQGKLKYSEKTCPSATLPTWLDLESNTGRRGGKPAADWAIALPSHVPYSEIEAGSLRLEANE